MNNIKLHFGQKFQPSAGTQAPLHLSELANKLLTGQMEFLSFPWPLSGSNEVCKIQMDKEAGGSKGLGQINPRLQKS